MNNVGRFNACYEETVECLLHCKTRTEVEDQLTVCLCQRSLPLSGRTCVFCVILVGKVKARISLSLVYYVGLLRWQVRVVSSVAIYVQRTTHMTRACYKSYLNPRMLEYLVRIVMTVGQRSHLCGAPAKNHSACPYA